MTKELLQQALDALTRLSFLGNGDFPGNSEGNRIAQKAVSDIKQALAQQEPDDYASAKRLAETIYRRHYRAEAPNWEPLPDLAGVLSQIDNMISGLVKAQQEQPAQEPVAWYLSEDSNILGVEWSRQKPKYGRDWTPLYKTAPTQPALSESQITSIAYNCNALPEVITDKTLVDFVRAIEAHCRGGNHG